MKGLQPYAVRWRKFVRYMTPRRHPEGGWTLGWLAFPLLALAIWWGIAMDGLNRLIIPLLALLLFLTGKL
jgi:hypothetical protein